MCKRGEVWNAYIGEGHKGSIQNGTRPVVIISNNIGNKYSPCILVAVITSSQIKSKMPTHMNIQLRKPSVILTEQIFTINKTDLIKFERKLDENEIKQLDKCLNIAIGLDKNYK